MRLTATFGFKALIIEASLEEVLEGYEFTALHPNAVVGTIQAIAVRWGIQPWWAGSPVLAEAITATLLHKAFQLCTLQAQGYPRRFQQGDV